MIEKDANNCKNITNNNLRVKVFIYFADQWREKGIGYTNIIKIENDENSYQLYEEYTRENTLKSNENIENKNTIKDHIKNMIFPLYKLIIQSQQDTNERLLSTYINHNIDYHVQDGSILTWKEGKSEKALSFESSYDCNKFMKMIENIQQQISELISKINNSDITTNDDIDTQLEMTFNNDNIDEHNNNNNSGSSGSSSSEDGEWNYLSLDLRNDDGTNNEEVTNNNDDIVNINDSNSINFPAISIDTLDDWIQLSSFSDLNISNLIGNLGCEPSNSLLISRVASTTLNDDINQLYMYLFGNNGLKQFIDLFNYYEEENNYDLIVLYKLYKIFRNFIGTDNFDVFRLLFEESTATLMSIIGILEYDPTLDERVFHREYLKNKAKFRKFFLLDKSITKEYPVSSNSTTASNLTKDISNDDSSTIDIDCCITENGDQLTIDNFTTKLSTLEQICEKATLIYHIQYIIDYIMPTPSIFDDKLGPMTSYLNHHKAELCNLIYDNTMLLNNLFVFLTGRDSTYQRTDDNNTITKENYNDIEMDENDSSPTIDDYIDSVCFLHEFCLLSNSLNPSDKEFFFNWLESYNLLDVLCLLLRENNVKIRTKVVDIIALLVDYKVSSVRTFITNQIDLAINDGSCKTSNNISLIDDLLNTIIIYFDEPVSLHCINIVNILLDNDVLNNTDSSYFEKMSVFYDNFFTYSFNTLIKPIFKFTNNDTFNVENDTNSNAILLDKVLSLVSRWSGYHHELYIVSIMANCLIKYITMLLDSSHTFVVCGTVRLIRRLMDIRDININHELIKHQTLFKITDIFENCCLNSNNLLNNTIVEMFNFILTEDLDIFYMPLVDKYRDLFSSIGYIEIFKRLVARHDVSLNKSTGGVSLSINSIDNNSISDIYMSARKRKSCDFESSEDRWLNSEECDEDDDTNDKNMNNLLCELHEKNMQNSTFVDDNNVRHNAKKPKRSPMKVDIFDELIHSNSSDDKDNDDEILFELLMGNVCKNKPKNTIEDDDDIIDNISKSIITHNPKNIKNKINDFIKIYTNKMNSSRNLVIASQIKSNSSDEYSSDDNSPSKQHITEGNVLTMHNSTKELNRELSDLEQVTVPLKSSDSSSNKLPFLDSTFNTSNCLIETTIEDDSDENSTVNEESICSDAYATDDS